MLSLTYSFWRYGNCCKLRRQVKKAEKKMHFPLINVPELEKELTFLSERVIEKWGI